RGRPRGRRRRRARVLRLPVPRLPAAGRGGRHPAPALGGRWSGPLRSHPRTAPRAPPWPRRRRGLALRRTHGQDVGHAPRARRADRRMDAGRAAGAAIHRIRPHARHRHRRLRTLPRRPRHRRAGAARPGRRTLARAGPRARRLRQRRPHRRRAPPRSARRSRPPPAPAARRRVNGAPPRPRLTSRPRAAARPERSGLSPAAHGLHFERAVMQDTILETIRGNVISRQLEPEEHEYLASQARAICYLPGAYIFRESQPRREFGILVRGRVEIRKRSRGRDQVLALLGPGDSYAEGTLLDDYPHSTSAYVSEPVEAIEFPREIIMRIAQERPMLYARLAIA